MPSLGLMYNYNPHMIFSIFKVKLFFTTRDIFSISHFHVYHQGVTQSPPPWDIVVHSAFSVCWPIVLSQTNFDEDSEVSENFTSLYFYLATVLHACCDWLIPGLYGIPLSTYRCDALFMFPLCDNHRHLLFFLLTAKPTNKKKNINEPLNLPLSPSQPLRKPPIF